MNRRPNFQTMRTEFLNPFVTQVTELLFAADQRNTPACNEFRQALARWALAHPIYTGIAGFERPQVQLRDVTNRLNQLIPRPMDAPQAPAANPAAAREEQLMRDGVNSYLQAIQNDAGLAARRTLLTGLLSQPVAQRTLGDRIELEVASIVPHCQNPNTEATYNQMLTYAVYRHLNQHHRQVLNNPNPTEAMLAPIRTELGGAARALNSALALHRNGQSNAHRTAYTQALDTRNNPQRQN